MNGIFTPDVLAGLLLASGFVAGMIWAYGRGRQDALAFPMETFDCLPSRLSLNDTCWCLEWKQPSSRSHPSAMQLQQIGSRLCGTGHDAEGRAWHLEGIVHRRRAWCTVRCAAAGDQPQTWLIRAVSRERFLGYAIQASGPRLQLRELSLTRTSLQHGESSLIEASGFEAGSFSVAGSGGAGQVHEPLR